MTSFGTNSALPSFAVPDERGGHSVPAGDGFLQPPDQLRHTLGMLAAECPPTNDVLDGFRHVLLNP